MTSETMNRVGKLLITKKLTIAFAESATAGRLSSDFSMIEDAGKFLKGGIACYDACVKEGLLSVDPKLIAEFTPESMEVTRAISLGIARVIPADIHIGITGLTCPGGSETEEKPVGTMFIYAVRDSEQIFSQRLNFTGSRWEIVSNTVNRCAELLEDYLRSIK
jgi:nicotinamide-nucleotide amidase